MLNISILMDSINYLLSIETKGIKLGLQRTRGMMEICGNPHLDLPVIQVVGTNGKGSVCAILASILRAANYKTGLFTSPHLVRVNERIRINGKAISDLDIDYFIQSYKNGIEKLDASFFEIVTALACWYFQKNNVDISIMETGLGGRLDSASICNPLATVITPISLDHTEILGETVIEIAREKAGAMKKGVSCLSARQSTEVSAVLKYEASKKGAPIHFLNKESLDALNVNIPDEKQRENAQLAISVLNHVSKFHIQNSAIKNGLKVVNWYGRNQIIQKNPLVIFDVAHNVDSFQCFLNYYKSIIVVGKSTLIIALYSKKRIKNIVPQLENVFQNIICTEAGEHNPMSVDILKEHFNLNHNIEIIKDASLAIRTGLERLYPEDAMAIVGTHCLGPAVNDIFKISFDNL